MLPAAEHKCRGTEMTKMQKYLETNETQFAERKVLMRAVYGLIHKRSRLWTGAAHLREMLRLDNEQLRVVMETLLAQHYWGSDIPRTYELDTPELERRETNTPLFPYQYRFALKGMEDETPNDARQSRQVP